MAHYGTRTKNSKDVYETPIRVYAPWVERFRLNLDACATAANAILPDYIDPAQDGLTTKWAPRRPWCNPPFSQIGKWVEKMEREGKRTIVVALMADRPEVAWFRDHVEDVAAEIWAVDPRIQYLLDGVVQQGNNHASIIAVYRPGHVGKSFRGRWRIGRPIPPVTM